MPYYIKGIIHDCLTLWKVIDMLTSSSVPRPSCVVTFCYVTTENITIKKSLQCIYVLLFSPFLLNRYSHCPLLPLVAILKVLYSCICMHHWGIYCIYAFPIYINGACYRSCSVSFYYSLFVWSIYSANVHLAHCCLQLHDVW